MTESYSSANDRGISGGALKIIAVITMLIDHIGAVFLRSPIPYYTCRLIGRIAFPIFAFLLVEGFFHTKNLKKYCLRLALFALISEVPFDLAFHQTYLYRESQNVFFTLLIGLLTIAAIDYIKHTFADREFVSFCYQILLISGGMFFAWLLKTDYHAVGVAVIFLFYQFHQKKTMSSIYACLILFLSLPLEIASFAAVPLICCYNGKRGISVKYFFYLFYPVHLLLLSFFNAAGASFL